ncbi:hypothetical protein CJF12_02835 [Chryseobacterium piperi]|nr:hypothetical protein CJF12_02835 [Chryseobacterium piperi]
MQTDNVFIKFRPIQPTSNLYQLNNYTYEKESLFEVFFNLRLTKNYKITQLLKASQLHLENLGKKMY